MWGVTPLLATCNLVRRTFHHLVLIVGPSGLIVGTFAADLKSGIRVEVGQLSPPLNLVLINASHSMHHTDLSN